MKKINLVFDDEYDDVAIMLVQDEFCNDVNRYMSEFDVWAHDKENGCFKNVDGHDVCCVDTGEFVRWLNLKFGKLEKEQAKVIKQNTKYDSSLPIAEL